VIIIPFFFCPRCNTITHFSIDYRYDGTYAICDLCSFTEKIEYKKRREGKIIIENSLPVLPLYARALLKTIEVSIQLLDTQKSHMKRYPIVLLIRKGNGKWKPIMINIVRTYFETLGIEVEKGSKKKWFAVLRKTDKKKLEEALKRLKKVV